jgi:hypothetical protein
VPKSTLGSVYRRLGDLQKLNANWGQAVEDYGQAYKLYAQEVEADSRVLAEVRVCPRAESSGQRGCA